MIEIRDVVKSYNGITNVLDGVSVTLPSSNVSAILGPNGSGKSTLMKLILGLVTYSSGDIVVDGKSILGESMYRADIGYMPQAAKFPENLSARELFLLVKDVRNTTATSEDELIELFNLDEALDKPLKSLSGGTKQKVNAVVAFMFSSKILLLDEPTAGLDPVMSTRFKDFILQEKKKGSCIVLTSHIMSEVQDLADSLVFLLEGKVYYNGSIQQLLDTTETKSLEHAVAQLMQNNSVL